MGGRDWEYLPGTNGLRVAVRLRPDQWRRFPLMHNTQYTDLLTPEYNSELYVTYTTASHLLSNRKLWPPTISGRAKTPEKATLALCCTTASCHVVALVVQFTIFEYRRRKMEYAESERAAFCCPVGAKEPRSTSTKSQGTLKRVCF